MTIPALTRRAFVASSVLLALPALAQSFPSRPIRLVVPYPAGGSTDQLARAIQQPLAEILGQPIVIDNRAGAGGTIGTELVAKAAPDGYTLVFGNTGPNAVVSLLRKVPYDPVADLKPISTVAFTPMILAVPADSPAKTLKEFLAYARQQGSAMNYGSVGNGSLSHLTGEHFNELSGLKMLHVPYNGGAPMLTAFASGQLHAAFVTGLDGASMLASGKVRYLAVATPQRTDVVPGLPYIAEEVPGFASTAWFGVLAPKGVAPEVLARLHAAVVAAVARPEVRKLFAERMIEARSSTPQELEKLIASEQQHWGQVIRKGGITS
jgi:tripartite-type tricarboxylate transporter receptor subunit TctC